MAAASSRDAITDRLVAPSPGSSPNRMTAAGPRPMARAVRTVAAAAGVGVGAVLALVAAARRGKAVHPHGEVYAARLVVGGVPAAPAAAQLLATAGEHAALVRFSRSLGLPRPLPDLLGMSIRVLDAYGRGLHQDFLLVSSTDRPVLHHLLLPAKDVQQRPYSSSLPYRAGTQRFIVGALPDLDSPRPAGDDRARARADRRGHRSPAVPARGGGADGALHAGRRAPRRGAASHRRRRASLPPAERGRRSRAAGTFERDASLRVPDVPVGMGTDPSRRGSNATRGRALQRRARAVIQPPLPFGSVISTDVRRENRRRDPGSPSPAVDRSPCADAPVG